jgi:CHAT domain-containing protein
VIVRLSHQLQVLVVVLVVLAGCESTTTLRPEPGRGHAGAGPDGVASRRGSTVGRQPRKSASTASARNPGPAADGVRALIERAHAHRKRGEFREALATAREAVALAERVVPGSPELAASLHLQGNLARITGDYADSRAALARATAVYERSLGPNDDQVAAALGGLGSTYRILGDYPRAREALARSLAIHERNHARYHPLVGRSATGLANVLMLQNDHRGAARLLDRAIEIGEFHGARGRTLHLLPEALRLQADNLRRAGRPAAEWLPVARRGLAIVEQQTQGRSASYAIHLLVVALGEEGAGDRAAARSTAQRSAEVAKRQGRAEVRWRASNALGRLAEREGRLEDATAAYRDAVSAIESVAAGVGQGGARDVYLQTENRLQVYDALARVLLRLNERDRTKGYDQEAWAAIQAKKGRIVAEALSVARPAIADPEVRKQVAAIQAKAAEAAALERALVEPDEPTAGEAVPPPEEEQRVRDLTTRLARTKSEYLGQVQALLTRYPKYKAQFVDQQTVDPKALAKFAGRLPAGTLAVQYLATDDALYLYVVAAGGRFEVKRRQVSQAALYALIRRYRAHVERGTTAVLPWADDGSALYREQVAPLKAVGRELAEHLVGPIEPELAQHRNLILIPNDLLLYLPLHALERTTPAGPRFLAETHVVSYLTQLELADLLSPVKADATPPMLALANPDGSLPAAGREVQALEGVRPGVTVLVGEEATKRRFLQLAPSVSDIHLATHGVLDAERPERSFLLVAGRDERSRHLSLSDIAGLTLRPGGLAVLSACETALGEQVPGSALITFAAAFSQAGSQTIVASLWKVNDASTRDLMVAFHRALASGGRAEALRQAQLALLRKPATAHPFYWAAFILIGAR